MKQCLVFLLLIGASVQLMAQPLDLLKYSEPQPEISKNQAAFKHSLINDINSPLLIDTVKPKPSYVFMPKSDNQNRLDNKVDYSVNVGMSMGSAFKNDYYTHNYILPTAHIKLTKKLSANLGIGYSYTHFHNSTLIDGQGNLIDSEIQKHSFLGYASLVYQLSDRTSLFASVILDKSNLDIGTENATPLYTEMSLGLNYKISKNFAVKAQINYGNMPYSNNIFTPQGVHFMPLP